MITPEQAIQFLNIKKQLTIDLTPDDLKSGTLAEIDSLITLIQSQAKEIERLKVFEPKFKIGDKVLFGNLIPQTSMTVLDLYGHYFYKLDDSGKILNAVHESNLAAQAKESK